MNVSRSKTAIAALSLLGLGAVSAADAAPVTYNYGLDVTSTNITGLADGTLTFTLSAAPTTAQMTGQTDIKSELTAFDAKLDGFDFPIFASCGVHPTGCVSNLEFKTGGTLWNLTYTGQSSSRTDVTLTLNNTVFSHFYIQSNGQYADGNLVFLNNNPPASSASRVPEPSSLSLVFAGLSLLAMGLMSRRRAG